MNRSTYLIVAAVVALVLAACTSAGSASPTASPSESASVSEEASESASESAEESASEEPGSTHELTVSETSAGPALAGEGGMTLYIFTQDTEGQSACSGGCAENWPPLVLEEGEEAVGGDGVTGEIGTITRDDGATQVTYDGQPLYYYIEDESPGDATGEGVGDVWFIASPSGM